MYCSSKPFFFVLNSFSCLMVVLCFSGDFWRSTSIVDCIDRRQVKTKRGSLYVLKGPVDQSEMLEQGFSTASISAFRHGFPRNWKKLIREHAKQLKSALVCLLPSTFVTNFSRFI